MQTIKLNWKSNIFNQLKDHNRQTNIFQTITNHYDRLLENHLFLKNQYVKLDKEIQDLRLANTNSEKAFQTNQELETVSAKLIVANEEIMKYLREKGELAHEVVRLSRSLRDVNEKLQIEERKVQQYKIENEELQEKIKKLEFENNDCLQINQILRDEFSALRTNHDQLNIDYNRIKPSCLELEQHLETSKRMNQRLEDELISYKNQLASMHDHESEQFSKKIRPKFESTKQSSSSIFLDEDTIIIPSVTQSPDFYRETLNNSAFESTHNSYEQSLQRDRKSSSISLSNGPGQVFTNLFKKLTNDITNNTNDKLNRTLAFCSFASVPTHDLTQWDCTELEVYAIQFQPSGSLLATGCSDQMVHLWEVTSNGHHHKYGSLQGSHGAINALDFDNEGCRLLVGCSGDKAYVWSYGEQRTAKDVFTGHVGLISACKFISGSQFATGSADRTIRIWDLNIRRCIKTLLPGSKCHDLVVTDASGTIISGHFDKKIRIWDPFTDKCRLELKYDAAITSLSYNDERKQLLVCFKDDTIKLIDLRQNRTVYTLSHDNFRVSTDTTKVIFSPDGRYVCAGSHDGSLIVWNVDSAICETVLKQKHKTMVTGVTWHPEGKYVASCEKHRRVIIWSH